METSTLAEILGVEQQIGAHLVAERERASHWLEDARREMERAHEADLARLVVEEMVLLVSFLFLLLMEQIERSRQHHTQK